MVSRAALTGCSAAGCPESALSFSSHCWNHTEKKQYLSNLNKAIESIGPGPVSLNLKKVECEYLDLSGLDLSNSSLSQAEISNSLFIGTNLSGSDMIGSKFKSCDFVGAEIRQANFARAFFSNCSFSHADFRDSYFVEAHFKDVDFMGAGLYGAVLWNAELSGARNLKRKNFNDLLNQSKEPKARLLESSSQAAYESYRALKRLFYNKGFYEDASWASYKELTMQRKYFFETKDIRFIPSFLMDALSGYTEKPARVILSSLGMIFVYGLIYYLSGAVRGTFDGGAASAGFWDNLYFSFITFTTVGFGDFIPKSYLWVKILVSMEAFSGPFMAGLFVFTLTRRYAVN